MTYIDKINTFYPSLSKQEKKIADFFLLKKTDISLMSLQEINKQILVSEATIVRFVRKLGFKGFMQFRLEVAKEKNLLNEVHTDDYIEKIVNNIENTVKTTKKLIEKEKLEKSIELIKKSKNMYIFGLGASGVAAQEFENRIMRFGKMSKVAVDSHFQTMYASITTKEDLIVVISLSGETNDLLYSLKLAKNNGCKIIAITNYILSPIAKISDIVLLTSGRETPLDGGSLISKISQLLVIDLLATGYALENKKKSEKIKETIAEAIANKSKE